VEDNPSLPFNPLSRFRNANLPIRRRVAEWLGYVASEPSPIAVSRSATITPEAEQARVEILSLAKSDPNLTVIDTKSLFCSLKECSISDGKNLYYTDNNHFSGLAEKRIVSSLASAQVAADPPTSPVPSSKSPATRANP
jgi:hypothetical protein